MGQQTAYVKIGYSQVSYGVYSENYTWSPYIRVSDVRSARVQRPKPRGVELLFNGTDVTYSKTWRQIGTYAVYSRNLAGTQEITELKKVPLTKVGGEPYGVDIPDKYWSNKLRLKIRDTDINLAQSHMERAQCEHMFVDYGKRILRAYSFARKGNVSGILNSLLGTTGRKYQGWKQTVKDTTGVASDAWLAWQYGIRPLISDLEGAVKEYWKVRQTSPVIRYYRFKVSNDVRGGGVVDSPSEGLLQATVYTQKAKIVAYAEFQDSAQAWDQSAQRLGLTDPILLGWELIPYSFVVDWFINVGEFLQASGTFVGLKRIGIHVSTENFEDSYTTQKGGFAMQKVKAVSRKFKTSLPAATLHIKSSPMSVSHVTSALALIRQLRF